MRMLKLENKDIKTVITAIYHTFRDLSREDKDRERNPNQTFKGENVTFEMKIDWIRLRAG